MLKSTANSVGFYGATATILKFDYIFQITMFHGQTCFIACLCQFIFKLHVCLYNLRCSYNYIKNTKRFCLFFFQDDVMELDLEAELLASTFDKRRDFSSQSSACGSDLDSSFYR